MSLRCRTTWSYRWLVVALMLTLFGMPMHAMAADSGAPSPPGKARAVTLETVAGSPIKRVVLSPKAAERIDVRTGEVSEQAIVPTQMLGGIVVDPSAAGDPKSYSMKTFTYIMQAQHGSPEVDKTTPSITKVEVGKDNKSVRLYVSELVEGNIHELHATGVRNTEGLPLLHKEAYYTLMYPVK